ncbi:uncharacterized protein METZ01_LOCUS288875 [marine metagenome]|uniref:Uncharacterized protein n=1 Tax=marine metagenome TaxID=408172 RepID=A0A382LMA6_9ZZZZ
MITVLLNVFELIRVLKERGNWKLIRHSRNQLKDFIFCRSELNHLPLISIPLYWYCLLKGPDVLIWRLETFGFLFTSEANQIVRNDLNSYL